MMHHELLPIRAGSKASLMWRFCFGAHLDGVRRTDATFFHAGTKSLTPHRITRWSYLPGYQRGAIRFGVLTAIVATAWVWLRLPGHHDIARCLRILFWVSFPLALIAWYQRYEAHHHRQAYITPVARWYAKAFGVPEHEARNRITVPQDHLTNPDAAALVQLPHEHVLPERQQQEMVRQIGVKLGIRDVAHEMDFVGGRPTLAIRMAPPPPDKVAYDDVVDYLNKATNDRLFLGLGRRDAPVYLSWANDSPHAGLSFEPGMGKSTFCKTLAVQTIHHGGKVVVFDIGKAGESVADWCRDESGDLLPGLEVYRDAASGHDALIRWAAERLRRSNAVWDRTDEKFQRTLIIIEESNISIAELRTYWRTVRQPGDPVPSPAIVALQSLTLAGRSTAFNTVIVAQKLSAEAAGKESIREALGILLFGNASRRTLNNLIPNVKPHPRMTNHKGRVAMVVGGEVTELQVLQFTPEQARAWATSGLPQPSTYPTRGSAESGETDDLPGCPGRDDGRSLRLVPPLADDLVSILDACSKGIVTGTVAAIKQARKEDPTFPQHADQRGQTFFYRPDDLKAWQARRRGTAKQS